MAKIVIVEDNRFIKNLYEHMAHKIGFMTVNSFIDGEQPVEFMRKNTDVDFVLMDIELEGSKINGIEAAFEIRAFSDTPILFISGCSWEVVKPQIEPLSNVAFTSKIFSAEKLDTVIRSNFSQAEVFSSSVSSYG